ncbi:UpxY family transcription antiterminator [Melioribacter sp. OK-6-Me]|uniref:UpxY family transcription antiterminator n=1 Tax=unclassified Melioribacter TaxID=2627329 RepID=UPI003EDB2C63
MIERDAHKRNWFALYTKPRHEFKAQQQLHELFIEHYLPVIEVVRKWSDRKKVIKEPLFRSYIFIKADEKERLIALHQPSIVRTICSEGKPSIIPEWQIDNIKILLQEKPQVFVSNKIEIGTKVKIIEGPFTGIIGQVTQYNNEKWLSVSVDLLKRSILLKLPANCVVKQV